MAAVIRRRVLVRAFAALAALVATAMSCTTFYELRLDGEGGRVAIDGNNDVPRELPFTARFEVGRTVVLTPVPDEGFEFVRWEGAASGSDVPLEVELTGPRELRLVFEDATTRTPRRLAIDASRGAGDVVVDGADRSLPFRGEFEDGWNVEIEAVPASGYEFEQWSGDVATSDNPTTVAMTEDRSVTTEFVEVTVERDLTVEVVGSGSGSVASSPDGIDCGSDCTESFGDDTSVTLTATPDTGSTFAGWSGACSGTASCTVDMLEDRTVSATFVDPSSSLGTLSVDVEPFDASWTVREDDAGGAVVDDGTGDATLQLDPGSYHVSASRSNYEDAQSSVTLDAGDAETVLLELAALPFELTVTVEGEGSGAVTSSPAGIDCSGGTCSDEFDAGTSVTLTATPSGVDEFDGWSGACSGTGSCSVTMDQARSVTATFVPPDAPPEPEATLRIDVTPDDADWTVRNDSASGSTVDSGSGDATLSVDPGTYHVTANRALHAEASDSVTLADGDDETVTLSLTREYDLTVQGSNGDVLVDGTRESLPYTGTFLDGTTVELRSDPDSGYTFQSWSGDVTSTNDPLVVSVDREYDLTAGIADISPPSLSVTDPTDTYDDQSSVTITGTADDDGSGLAAVESRLNAGGWSGCEVTVPTFACTVSDLGFGVNLIEVRAADRAGNLVVSELDLRREDTTAPHVEILEPADGSTTLGTVKVSGVARDQQTGIAAVDHRLDGGTWLPCSTPSDTTFDCVVDDLVAGRASVIDVVATDDEGNTAGASIDVVYEPSEGFDIELVYFDESFTASQKDAFDAAVARWQEVVIDDLEDVYVQRATSGSCGRNEPALDRVVDDVVVFATSFTDGPGGLLGAAGPCLLRGGGTDEGTALIGYMEFDTADLDNLEASGALEATITHELGHVLGLGSLWERNELLVFEPSDDDASSCEMADDYLAPPSYVGPAGVDAWQFQLGGSGNVPVESTGERGTRCGHWEEGTFGDELMTGWIDEDDDPLSILSVRSLEDLGYSVDPDAADPYALPSDGALTKQGAIDLASGEVLLMPTGAIDPETGGFEELP